MAQTGFIYKLACKNPSIKEIYVGSTKNLRVRKSQHKHHCNNNNDFMVYQFIRDNGNFENWDIIQLEQVEFNTKFELRARERHYIESLNASLNQTIPNRSHTESDKNWHDNNRAILNLKIDCACGGKYTAVNKSTHLKTKRHTHFLDSQKVITELNNEL